MTAFQSESNIHIFKRLLLAAKQVYKRRKHIYSAIALCSLVVTAVRFEGIDFLQLLWSLRVEFQGKSAYGPEMAKIYNDIFPQFASIGMVYPLPAIWMSLPMLPFNNQQSIVVWAVLCAITLYAGIRLLNMPEPLLFFMPLFMGFLDGQPTMLLTTLMLLGIWAVREQKWWLASIIIALSVAAKPQTTLILAGALLIIALRAGAWRQTLSMGGLLAAITWALEPTWVTHFLEVVQRYQGQVGAVTVYSLLPFAAVAWLLQWPWAALALTQVFLFDISFKYALIPLLVCYVDLRNRWVAWIVVGMSWFIWLIEAYTPVWFSIGLCYALPVLIATAWSAREQRNDILYPLGV